MQVIFNVSKVVIEQNKIIISLILSLPTAIILIKLELSPIKLFTLKFYSHSVIKTVVNLCSESTLYIHAVLNLCSESTLYIHYTSILCIQNIFLQSKKELIYQLSVGSAKYLQHPLNPLYSKKKSYTGRTRSYKPQKGALGEIVLPLR